MTDDLTTKWLNPKPKGKWKNVQSEDETIIKLDSVSNFEINNEENDMPVSETDTMLNARSKNFAIINGIHYDVLNVAKMSRFHQSLYTLLKEYRNFDSIVLSLYKRGPLLSIVASNILNCEVDRILNNSEYVKFEGAYEFIDKEYIIITVDHIKSNDVSLLKDIVESVRDSNAHARIFIAAYYADVEVIEEIQDFDNAGKTEILYGNEIKSEDEILYQWTFPDI